MAESKYTELFRFEADGMPEDTFHVLGFKGTEALSSLFRFEINLVSKNKSLNLGALLAGNAKLTIKREGAPDAVFAGRPAAARQTGCFGEYAYYSVTLRPAFWKFTQLVQSAVFLDKNAPDMVKEIFGAERFFPVKYEMRLDENAYPAQEFSMQHEESLYDYITWRMEREGAYFYFAPDGDTVIFSDSPQSHDGPAGTIYYSPATGLEGDKNGEVATDFSLCQMPVPARVVVRGYSWTNPNVPIVAEAEVSPDGFGDVYLAHEAVETQAEAERIAKIRAEELLCASRVFEGVSASPLMRPGALFTLDRHYNAEFNRDYMVTEVTHEGAQEAFISMGLGIPIRGAAEHLFYRNEFRCIESDTPYRPPRTAPRAKITGVMRAFVDGAGSGARAETDEYGRYKLVFPFDISGRRGGNASCWIRMSQQQAGPDSGLSLPVQPGVEALVSFEEGDPDRPYISGVLANGETGSIYGSGNRNISGLRTAGGNQITINDEDKQQGMSLLTANGNGITMTAGSSDLMMSRTDSDLHTASVSMNSLAGIFRNNLCGFRSSTTASLFDPKTISAWEGVAASACSFISNVLTAHSKGVSGSEENARLWGADGVKDFSVVLSLILQCIDAGRKGATCYGVSLNSDGKTSQSLVQAKVTTAQLVALWLGFAAFKAAEVGLDIADACELSPVGEDNIYYDKNFNKVSKAQAVRSYSTSSAASLIPEITSLIVMTIAANKQAEKLGGVLLNAKEQNVNMTAATDVTAHAGEGILFHAGSGDAAGGAVMAGVSLDDMSKAHETLMNNDTNGPSHWGVPDAASTSHNGVVRPVLREDSKFLHTAQHITMDQMETQRHYIASIAEDLLYERANNSVSVTVKDKVEFAGNTHTARAGANGATMSLKEKQLLGYTPSDGRVKIGTVTGNYPAQADTVTDDELSGMIADKYCARLQFKDVNGVELNSDSVLVGMQNGSLVELKTNVASLSSKTIQISNTTGTQHAIIVDESGIVLSGLTVNGSKLSSGEPLQIKGQFIKIG